METADTNLGAPSSIARIAKATCNFSAAILWTVQPGQRCLYNFNYNFFA